MRQRPRPSALKMSEPRLGKWALRDYLYYQLNVGEILESPNGAPEQIAMQKSPRLDTYEVVLMAATQAEADRFLRLFEHAIHRHLLSGWIRLRDRRNSSMRSTGLTLSPRRIYHKKR